MADDRAAEAPLSAVLERLPDLVNGDAALQRRGREVTAEVMIEIGTQQHHVAIAQGRIAQLRRGPLLMRSWSFAVRGGEEAWRSFWQPFPPPHCHDIFALAKSGAFRIEGDFRPLITHLLYFKGLLAAPRRLHRETP